MVRKFILCVDGHSHILYWFLITGLSFERQHTFIYRGTSTQSLTLLDCIHSGNDFKHVLPVYNLVAEPCSHKLWEEIILKLQAKRVLL